MNGVEGVGSMNLAGRVPGVTGTTNGQSTTNQNRKQAGLEGALKMSEDFLRKTMAEIGFVDLQAGKAEQIQMFVRHLSGSGDEQGGLDPLAASEIAARTGAQIAGDVNQALRILTQVDPQRAAALLK